MCTVQLSTHNNTVQGEKKPVLKTVPLVDMQVVRAVAIVNVIHVDLFTVPHRRFESCKGNHSPNVFFVLAEVNLAVPNLTVAGVCLLSITVPRQGRRFVMCFDSVAPRPPRRCRQHHRVYNHHPPLLRSPRANPRKHIKQLNASLPVANPKHRVDQDTGPDVNHLIDIFNSACIYHAGQESNLV